MKKRKGPDEQIRVNKLFRAVTTEVNRSVTVHPYLVYCRSNRKLKKLLKQL